MIIQIIGIAIAILGLLIKLKVAFLIGGFILLAMDLYGFFTGQLNPLFPIILYVVGFMVVGGWTGILYGALFGNALDVVVTIFGMGIF